MPKLLSRGCRLAHPVHELCFQRAPRSSWEGSEASVEPRVQHRSKAGSDGGREGMKKKQTHTYTRMEKMGLGELHAFSDGKAAAL